MIESKAELIIFVLVYSLIMNCVVYIGWFMQYRRYR